MDDFYREAILDHYRNPRNRGEIVDADLSYQDSNPLCGDELRIDLKVQDGVVEDVKFTGRGCAISQASASMLTEVLEGKTLDEVKQLDKEDIFDMLGIELSPVRVKCALLSLKVLKGGVYGISDLEEDE